MLSKSMVGAFDIDKLQENFSTQQGVDTTSRKCSQGLTRRKNTDTYHRNYLQVSRRGSGVRGYLRTSCHLPKMGSFARNTRRSHMAFGFPLRFGRSHCLVLSARWPGRWRIERRRSRPTRGDVAWRLRHGRSAWLSIGYRSWCRFLRPAI